MYHRQSRRRAIYISERKVKAGGVGLGARTKFSQITLCRKVLPDLCTKKHHLATRS